MIRCYEELTLNRKSPRGKAGDPLRRDSPEVLGPLRMNRSEPEQERAGPAPGPLGLGPAAWPSSNRGDPAANQPVQPSNPVSGGTRVRI